MSVGAKAPRWGLWLLAGPLLALLAVPLAALVGAASFENLQAGVGSQAFGPALMLSVRTSVVSLGLMLLCGTPLAWWMATTERRVVALVRALVNIPVVLPPAVVGIALLQCFGRAGVLGEALASWGVQLPFTTSAVILAQVLVATPFYVQAAAAAFAQVDGDTLLVARTLGASPWQGFVRVVLPGALPGLLGGAALAWARALGEFGATLLFAGNLPGTTQTMPLAIYTALESDVRVALALALVLAGVCVMVLLGLRQLPRWWAANSAVSNGGAS